MSNSIEARLANFKAKLELDPDNGMLWLEYGDFIDEEWSMPREVISAYENAARLLPKKDLRARIGAAYVDAGDSDVGLALINQSVSENPRAHGFCILAGAYIQLEDFASAKKAAEQAISLDSDFEEGYYLLGLANRSFSSKDAITCFRSAINLDNNYGLAWQALGRELAKDQGTLGEAISAFRKALEIDPDDGWSMAYLANSLWRTESIREAEQWYQKAVRTFPDCEEFKRWYEQFQNETQL